MSMRYAMWILIFGIPIVTLKGNPICPEGVCQVMFLLVACISLQTHNPTPSSAVTALFRSHGFGDFCLLLKHQTLVTAKVGIWLQSTGTPIAAKKKSIRYLARGSCSCIRGQSAKFRFWKEFFLRSDQRGHIFVCVFFFLAFLCIAGISPLFRIIKKHIYLTNFLPLQG